jgi:hypothetical protein
MKNGTYLGYAPPPDFDEHQTETGAWFRIIAEPDSFTRERFNIGIGIIDTEGRRYVKVLTERGRLECVFGPSNADSILMMAETAARCFEAGTAMLFENIILSDANPLYDRLPKQAIEQLFSDQVTFAAPQRIESARPAAWLSRTETRETIYEIIRERIPATRHNGLIPQSLGMRVDNGSGKRKLVHIPLQPANGAGGLESACYSLGTVKTHLMDSMLNLQAVANANELKRVGMFVLRPATGMSQRQRLAMDNVIDDVLWRAPRTWTKEVEEDPAELTNRILEWADLQAA